MLGILGMGSGLLVLLLTRIHICRLLKTIQLIMLHEKGLLDHCLIRLGEEVVFLDIILATRGTYLSKIPLQIVAFRLGFVLDGRLLLLHLLLLLNL